MDTKEDFDRQCWEQALHRIGLDEDRQGRLHPRPVIETRYVERPPHEQRSQGERPASRHTFSLTEAIQKQIPHEREGMPRGGTGLFESIDRIEREAEKRLAEAAKGIGRGLRVVKEAADRAADQAWERLAGGHGERR